MGIMPDQFYPMRVDDFNLMRRGYFKKREDQVDITRTAVAMIISPWLKTPIDKRKLWPLNKDSEYFKEQKERAQKVLKSLRSGIEYRKVGKVIVPVKNESTL
jgi:hypothetical protein